MNRFNRCSSLASKQHQRKKEVPGGIQTHEPSKQWQVTYSHCPSFYQVVLGSTMVPFQQRNYYDNAVDDQS